MTTDGSMDFFILSEPNSPRYGKRPYFSTLFWHPSLRRFPHGVRNWTSLVDRTHWKNHQACHLGYNMDLYPQLKGVNSQQAEQINRSLRSLSVVLAYSTFDHYMRILELYFVYKNVKTRQGFNKD